MDVSDSGWDGYYNGVVYGHLAGLIRMILVAASDASDIMKQVADYVCDGVDDHVVIQVAVDAC